MSEERELRALRGATTATANTAAAIEEAVSELLASLIDRVEAAEVAMGEYVAATIPDPAVLAQFAGTYPAASTARYPSFQVNDTYVPQIDDLVDASGRRPTLAELDKAADDLWALDAGVPYVIVSPGMIDSIEQVASLPVGSTLEAVDMLTVSERFVVRHRIGDTFLMGVTP